MIVIRKWLISLDFILWDDEFSIGIGWWHGCRAWFVWGKTEYGSLNFWGYRLGPFYFSRGPHFPDPEEWM